jgi:hypothetical protein
MIRFRNGLHFIFGVAGLIGALSSGCGDDDSGDDNGGQGGEGGKATTGGASTGTGGKATGTGGKATGTGGSGTGTAGDAGEGGTGQEPTGGMSAGGSGPGTDGGSAGDPGADGGAPPVPSKSDVDDVIASVCDWEFRCCDDGERLYRLSPFATDAADCAERLVYELRESNATDNPYSSGPAAVGGLLGTLGYIVNLERVNVDASGAAECMEWWDELGCTEAPDPGARCTGAATANPCALTNLFTPKLALGDECTESLAETGVANDVECVAGSTCLPAAHPDNPNDVPTCVARGLSGDPCTADDDCDFNLFCNDDGDCEDKADVGETCSFKDPDAPAPNEEEIRCKAGLSCHPLELECISPCTLGYTCAVGATDADNACPAGSGCAPIAVAESENLFRVCTALGDAPPDLCNSDADCVEASHCETRICQPDRVSPTACTAQNQCAEGLHCDLGNTGTCIANFAPMTACTSDYQCGPAPSRCVNTGAGSVCRATLLPLGDTCGSPAACASGRCELATPAAVSATCVAGANESAACDGDLANGNALSCRPGFGCIGGICVAQVGAGGDCSPTNGMPNGLLCANGSVCADPWEEDGEICTDAAVPVVNGGTGLVCDGS